MVCPSCVICHHRLVCSVCCVCHFKTQFVLVVCTVFSSSSPPRMETSILGTLYYDCSTRFKTVILCDTSEWQPQQQEQQFVTITLPTTNFHSFEWHFSLNRTRISAVACFSFQTTADSCWDVMLGDDFFVFFCVSECLGFSPAEGNHRAQQLWPTSSE